MIETACKKRIRRVTRCWIKTDFHRRVDSARPMPELKFRLVGFELIPSVQLDIGSIANRARDDVRGRAIEGSYRI